MALEYSLFAENRRLFYMSYSYSRRPMGHTQNRRV